MSEQVKLINELREAAGHQAHGEGYLHGLLRRGAAAIKALRAEAESLRAENAKLRTALAEQGERHDTKGSRKALGAMNAKLRAKVGRLERELAALAQSERVPEGWSITREGESIIVRREQGTAVELNHDGPLGERVMYGFLDSMLDATISIDHSQREFESPRPRIDQALQEVDGGN